MEQRNTHCFHEGNFTYLKNKAKYGRTGYFSSYAFTLIYPVFTLFNLDIYQKVFASDMFWFDLFSCWPSDMGNC
jgi:hypothetical protein